MKNRHRERNHAQYISHSPVTATVIWSVAEALKTVGILVSLEKNLNFIPCVSCFAPPNEMLTLAYFLDTEHCNTFFPITLCSLLFPRHMLTYVIVTVCYRKKKYICLWLRPYKKRYKNKRGKWGWSKHETTDLLSGDAFLRALTMFCMHHVAMYARKERYVCWVTCYRIPDWNNLPLEWRLSSGVSGKYVSATKLPRSLS